MTLIEVVIALSLFAVVTLGMAASTSLGMKVASSAGGRQLATQLASTEMEHLRAMPYDAVGLDPATTFDTSPTSPDSTVATSGTGKTWQVPGGAVEDVVLDGNVDHQDSDGDNGFTFAIYRYVTWIDSSHTAKRSTVVVQWGSPQPTQLVQSSIFSPGAIAWAASTTTTTTTVVTTTTTTAPGATTTTTAPATTTTTAPATTTTTANACAVSTSPPAGGLTIVPGPGATGAYTRTTAVILSPTVTDPCPVQVQFANAGQPATAWQDFTGSVQFALAAGDGVKTVQAWFKDSGGRQSGPYSATITLDTVPPATPTQFSVNRAANKKTTTITWKSSSDSPTGYHLWRSPGISGPATEIIATVPATAGSTNSCTTGTCLFTDNSVSTKTTYTYYLTAYDVAGNESASTAQVNA